jgi:hypothetical protein
MSRIVLLLLIVLNSIAALALDPVLRMSQYEHTSWRLQDGVFNGIRRESVDWVVRLNALEGRKTFQLSEP